MLFYFEIDNNFWIFLLVSIILIILAVLAIPAWIIYCILRQPKNKKSIIFDNQEDKNS